MKTTLIFLASLAVILGIFAYFAVFGAPTGSYAVSALGSASNTAEPSLVLVPLPSSTIATTTTAASGGSASSSSFIFGTSFGTSPLTWPEGQSHISITAVSIEDTQLTFTLKVQADGVAECVPLNLRLVADEEGDLDPPNPASFAFPDTGTCNDTPNEAYTNQTTTFTVDPTTLPLLFTTGGASNIFFEVTTTTNDGLNIDFPGTSG